MRPRPGPSAVRLFDSPVLERLSQTHPAVPALLWAPVSAWLLWRSVAIRELDARTTCLLAAGGVLAWTLVEYLVHRFLFHMRPSTPRRARLQYILHGNHHQHPDDPRRQLMPPAPAMLAHAVLYGLFAALLGPAHGGAFFAGFLAGHLAYDYLHFAVHQGALPTRFGRALRRWHLAHHHATPGARWGVSSPLWDLVFRTAGSGRRLTAARPESG